MKASSILVGAALLGGSLGVGTAMLSGDIPNALASPKDKQASPTPKARTYFRNCRSARAAMRAPIHRGEPGYRSGLDRDGDGVACEPYHGPRHR